VYRKTTIKRKNKDKRVEEQTHQDCLPSLAQIDLRLGERAALRSTMNESLQEMQRNYKKLASGALQKQTLISTPFSSLSQHTRRS